MNKKRKEIIANNKISDLRTYTLGGIQQKVLIEGKNENSTVMLVLHGGPGYPIPFSVGCRGMFPEFTDNFIMVYWDQLGCGINNHIIDDSFCVYDFVDMTLELIQSIKKDFPENKFILFGSSWGSVLAAKAASIIPEAIDGVLVNGQLLNHTFFNQEVYEILENCNLPVKIKNRLIAIKANNTHTPADVNEIAALIKKYTEGYFSNSGAKTNIFSVIPGMLTSPDYKLKDLLAIIKNGYIGNTSLWNELIVIDLSNEIKTCTIPYHIVQGDKDIVTSTKHILEFVKVINNPMVSVSILDNSGHIPNAAGLNKILLEAMELNKIVSPRN